jgi:hypothetical protein
VSLIAKLPENRRKTAGIWEKCYPKTAVKSFLINGLWNRQGRLSPEAGLVPLVEPDAIRDRGATFALIYCKVG